MKNKIVLFFSLLLFSFSIDAQTDTAFKPEKLPEFKGGMKAWFMLLERNLDRDLPAKRNAPAGSYQAIVSFLIDVDGKLSDFKIEKDPGYGIGEEALRVIKLSDQKWFPAFHKGNVIPYRKTQSITMIRSQ